MRILPPFTGDHELDAWNQEVAEYLKNLPAQPIYDQGTGMITNPVDNEILGYLERYLHVRYADDRIGTNFSNSQTDRLFYGIHNDPVSVESTDPTDYTWFEVEGGFGTTKNIYFRNLGGRACELRVATAPPSYKWNLLDQFAIDLDDLLGPGTVGSSEITDGAVTAPKLGANSVTKEKMADAAVGLAELETTGTPSSDTYLNGSMQWARVQTGLFLPQYILLVNVYATPDMAGGHMYHPITHDYARIFSIPNPAVQDFEIGTCFVIINLKNTVTVRTDVGTINLIGAGTSSLAFAVAEYGKATLTKVEADRWVIEGTGLTAVADPGASIGEGDFNFLSIAEGEGSSFDFLG